LNSTPANCHSPTRLAPEERSALALRLDRRNEMPVLRHINKDHVIPDLQPFQTSLPPDDGTLAEAMRGQCGLAAGSCVSNRFGG
jgi:hypothetical protein